MMIIVMLWTGTSCRGRQCWLWLKRGPASAPKLRQNRFKYSATTTLKERIVARHRQSILIFLEL